jgi:hypothetical protein
MMGGLEQRRAGRQLHNDNSVVDRRLPYRIFQP